MSGEYIDVLNRCVTSPHLICLTDWCKLGRDMSLRHGVVASGGMRAFFQPKEENLTSLGIVVLASWSARPAG